MAPPRSPRTRPVSQALEWFGSALAPKEERITAFVRAVPHREGGSPLLAEYFLERFNREHGKNISFARNNFV